MVSDRIPPTIEKDGQTYETPSVDGDLSGTAGQDITITASYVLRTPDEPVGPETPDEPVGPETPDEPAGPVTLTPTPTPAPPVTPVAEVEDEEVPLANINAGTDDKVKKVEDEGVPLAGGIRGAWALLNLILAILTVLTSVLLLFFYFFGKEKDNEEDEDEQIREIRENEEAEEKEKLKRKGLFRLLSIVPAVVSVIFFILTEDMRNPMIFVDKWTLWMVVFALANVILAIFSKKSRKEDGDNKEDTNYELA